MKNNRRNDLHAANRNFCFVFAFLTVLIITLISVVIYLAVKHEDGEGKRSIYK